MSKRKPHSMADRWRRQAQYAVKGYGAAFVAGNELVECIDMRTGKVTKADPTLARAICDAPHFWTVLISVMGRDWEGKSYYQHQTVQTKVRYRQANLVEFFNEQHQALLAKMPEKYQAGAGWIAVPDKVEICEVMADRIYTGLGAWQ